MKKISLLLITLLGVSVYAQENSLSLKYGLTSLKVDGGTKFENSTLSLDGVYDLGYPINPRLDLAYISSPTYFASSNSNNKDGWGGADSLLQFAISGQYQTSTDYKLSPYVFGGIGYERVNHSVKCFSSNPFLQLGTGLKYALNEQVNLLGEFKALQMLGGDNQDNELLFSLGLNFPFNAPLVQSPVVNTPNAIQTINQNAIQTINQTSTLKDSDHDGVADEADLCPNTVLKKEDMVDKNGCKIQILLDSDNDGLTDDVDACKFTPFELRKSVDKRGCAKGEKANASIKKSQNKSQNFSDAGNSINLHINFDSNRAKVKSKDLKKIKDFASYIQSLGANTMVIINGYSDNSGSEAKNRKLSSDRAFAVRKALIKAGLKPTQVRAYGLGSINPIAPNDTADGREKNRRIEAVIEK